LAGGPPLARVVPLGVLPYDDHVDPVVVRTRTGDERAQVHVEVEREAQPQDDAALEDSRRDLGVAHRAHEDGVGAADLLELRHAVEFEPDGNTEALAERRGEEAGARCGADKREAGKIDADLARRRSLADDEVELKVLHGRIEDLLDRRIEPVDLVDE